MDRGSAKKKTGLDRAPGKSGGHVVHALETMMVSVFVAYFQWVLKIQSLTSQTHDYENSLPIW